MFKTRVAHIVRDFSAPSQTFIYDQILNLSNQKDTDHKVFVFRHRYLEKERPYENLYYINEPLNFYDSKKEAANFYLKLPKLIKQKIGWPDSESEEKFLKNCFIETIKEYRPHILHCHFGWSAYYLKDQLLGKEFSHIPLVINFHGGDVTYWPNRDKKYRAFLKQLQERNKTAFTAHSEFLRELLCNTLACDKKIHRVNNACNYNFSKMASARAYHQGESLKIINVARHNSWKGQRYLIKAFAKFCTDIYADSQLLLVGEGKETDNLKQLAEELGVKDKVIFHGLICHDDIPALLAQSHIYIQPSIIEPGSNKQEGMPISLIEAIHVKLPVVVTNSGGMPEMVKRYPFSRVAEHSDSKALYSVMANLFANMPTQQELDNVSLGYLKDFSSDSQIDGLYRIYSGLINE